MWNVIRVRTRVQTSGSEVEQYIYGRWMYLDEHQDDELPNLRSLFYLVEQHYAQAVIDRLGSGLFGAGYATPEERYDLGL